MQIFSISQLHHLYKFSVHVSPFNMVKQFWGDKRSLFFAFDFFQALINAEKVNGQTDKHDHDGCDYYINFAGTAHLIRHFHIVGLLRERKKGR